MAIKRKNIPNATEGELLFRADYKCCVCNKRGDHIHHLDEIPSNNNIDNLVFLCFPHHNEASIKNSLSKTLKKEAIIKYRLHHYKVIENKRKKELGELDRPIKQLTEEKLLTVTKTALIILELENIKSSYFFADWNKRSEMINELSKYVNHTNNRLAHDIIEFLSMAASQTRAGMTEDVASNILAKILSFCPSLHIKEDRKQAIELAKQCIYIGDSIAYDSFIHLRKINIAMYGLTIMKFIYRQANENNITELKKEVLSAYKRLQTNLERPDRTDLIDAQEILKTFKEDLQEWDLAFPVLSEHLMERLAKEQKNKKH